jgi:hypothetical protein
MEGRRVHVTSIHLDVHRMAVTPLSEKKTLMRSQVTFHLTLPSAPLILNHLVIVSLEDREKYYI